MPIKFLQKIFKNKIEINLEDLNKKIETSIEKTSEIREYLEKYEKTKKQLDFEREKFRLLFEKSPLVKLFLSLDGTIQKTNDAFCKTFGYCNEDVIGHNILDFVYEEDMELAKSIPERFITGDLTPVRMVHKYKTKYGAAVYLRINIYPIKNNGDEHFVVGVGENITKELESENILNEKNKFISKVLKTAPGTYYVYDIINNKNVWTSKEIVDILGYTKQELLDMDDKILEKIMYPEDYVYYLENIYENYKKLKDNEVLENEYRFIDKDGKIKWFRIIESVFSRDENDNIIEVIGNMINIDNIKNTESLLKLNTLALTYAKDAIVITDVKANIVFVNKAFEKNTGYCSCEVIGKNPNILKSDKHEKNFYEDMWKTLTNRKTWNGTIINKTKSGKYITEKTTITPVLNGEIKYYIAIKELI